MPTVVSQVNKVLLVLLSISSQMLYGQLNNGFFQQNYPKKQWESSALFFHKNSEYFDPVAPGQTLLGGQFRTEFHKSLGQGALLSGGFLAQCSYGANQSGQWLKPGSAVRIYPLLAFRFEYKKQRWQIGHGPGPLSHDLPETLMNYDWAWKRPVEYGIDFRLFDPKLQMNAWLDWRQLAIPDLSEQEIISGGVVANPIWYSKNDVSIGTPVSALIYHQGGENLAQRKPLVTQINIGSGFRLNFGPWEFNSHFMHSEDASPQLKQPYQDGWASSSWIKFKSNHWEYAMALQSAHEFSAPLGAPLYSSVDRMNPYTTVRDRCILQARVHYTHPLPTEGVHIDARLEPMFDCLNQKILLSAGAYLKVEF